MRRECERARGGGWIGAFVPVLFLLFLSYDELRFGRIRMNDDSLYNALPLSALIISAHGLPPPCH